MLNRSSYLVGVGFLVAAAFTVGHGRDAHAGIFGCDVGTVTAIVSCSGTSDSGATTISKEWIGVPTVSADYHTFDVDPAGPSHTFDEDVTNSTGVAWTDYHIAFGSDEPFTMSGLSLIVSATVLVTDGLGTPLLPTGGVFTCGIEGSPLCEFSIFFGSPLLIGETFHIGATLTDLQAGVYFVTQYPTVMPEPGALAIFGLGLVALGLMRRRRAV